MKSALALALFITVSSAARASPGLDLILILDCSKSMARDPVIGRLFLDHAIDVVSRNAAAYGLHHRVAIITFGSTATADVGWTAIRPDSGPIVHQAIGAIPPRHRGDTDILEALRVASILLQDLPNDPSRRRAIVLLTDGVPYVRGTDMPSYAVRLREFITTRFVRRQVSLDVVLIGPAGPSGAGLWKSIPGNVHPTTRAREDILADGHGVIAHLIGTQTAEGQLSKARPDVDVLIVPPYLDLIVFDIFLGSTGADVQLFPPRAQTPVRHGTGGVERVRIGEWMGTLVVPRPAPGQWTIRKNRPGARVRVLSQQFFPRGVLERPAAGESPRATDLVTIAYRLVDTAGAPVKELPEYALSMEMTLLAPDGKTTVLPVDQDADRGRRAYSSRPVACDVPGRYWTDIRVTTHDLSGGRIDVFRDRWSGFVVAPPRDQRANSLPPIEADTPRITGDPIVIAIAIVLAATIVTILRARHKPTQ